MAPSAIGVDFGTESGRVLVLDLRTGEELAVAEVRYPHGVIDQRLPSTGVELPPDTALQDPADYLEVLCRGIPEALAAGNVAADDVVGIGIDFTCCTVLPVTGDGTPLCEMEQWRDRPHAWVKLWKHHAAQPVADRLNEVALERGEPFLARYGGRISSEWYFPKLIEIWQKDRPFYDAMRRLRRGDRLDRLAAHRRAHAGVLRRGLQGDAGPPGRGFPPVEPSSRRPSRASPARGEARHERSRRSAPAPGRSEEVAPRLGLPQPVAVAVGNVDSFVSVPGAGVDEPGVFLMVIGTSICDMVVHPDEFRLPGITGRRVRRHPARFLRL